MKAERTRHEEASTPTHVMITLGLSGFRHPLQTSPDGWMIGSHAYSTPRDSFAYPTEPPPRLMHAVLQGTNQDLGHVRAPSPRFSLH
jgi:hypothetical protein